MKISAFLTASILICVASQVLAWWGGGSSSSSSRTSSGSGSSRSGRGWGSRDSNRRVSISRPARRPKPAPKPAPKPKPSGGRGWGSRDSNRRRGWRSRDSNRRVSISRPARRPKPAPKPAPKPKPSGGRGWGSRDSNRRRGWGSRDSNRRRGWGSRDSNRRVSISRPARRPKPAPKPAPKPKPSGGRGWGSRDSNRRRGWGSRDSNRRRGWGSRDSNRRVSISRPARRPKPAPKPAPKPKPSGVSSIKNPNYIPYKEKTFKHPENTKDVIKAFETHGGEPNLKMYNAKTEGMKKDPTIGYGFSLDRKDARKTFKAVLPGVDFDRVKAGTASIKKEDARKLFNHDVDKIYQPRARNKLGANVFDKLPANVKTAVVNAQFRGDLGPKTIGYMKNGEWNKVSTEYLNHNGYKNASKNKMNGIVQRMNWNAKQFDSMSKNG